MKLRKRNDTDVEEKMTKRKEKGKKTKGEWH